MKNSLDQFQENCQNKILENAKVYGLTSDGSEPIYDGICDINNYINSPLKIMWILKEAYSVDKDGNNTGGGWDIYQDWDNIDVIKRNQTWRVMAKILYGINTGSQYDEMPPINEDMLNSLKASVYINVNKMPGGTTTKKSLKKEYQIWEDILFEQIDGYKPDVIIFGNTYNIFRSSRLDNSERVDNSGENIAPIYKTSDGILLVDTFHPKQTQYKQEQYINSIINNIRNVTKQT